MTFSRRVSKLLLLAAPLAMILAAQDAPVAIVNGKAVTKAEVDALLEVLPAEQRTAVSKDPTALLRYYGMLERISEIAEKAKLPEQSPIKEKLMMARRYSLFMTISERYLADHPSTPEDQEKFYKEHLDDYTSALVKVVYVPINGAGDESAAKAKAQSLVKQLAMGADFDELAEKNPLTGFPNVIKKSDTTAPEAIRTAVFALKKGGATAPIALANGVYLIRLQDLSVQALNDVRGDVTQRVDIARFSAWMLGIDQSVTVEIQPAK
jgi:parvulin-like peptidyl-prolyl isomerase